MGVGDAETIAAEHIDALQLAILADDARIAERHLLGEDDDAGDTGIDPHRLDHRVLDAGRRYVHHRDVEAVPGVHRLGDGVVDRDVVQFGLQHRAGAPRLHAADHVAAGIEMADRRHRAALVAKDVEHADAVVAGRELGQRVDADEIVWKRRNALMANGFLEVGDR